MSKKLLTRHASYIRGIAVYAVPNDLRNEIDVDQILQDLFLTLLKALYTYNEERGKFRPWLGGVTGKVIDSMVRIVRKEKARRSNVGPSTGDEEADNWLAQIAIAPSGERPSRVAHIDDLKSVVESMLAKLPEQDGYLLRRCDLEDVPHAKMAAELGISPAAVAMRLFRIRERCKELLGTRSDYL